MAQHQKSRKRKQKITVSQAILLVIVGLAVLLSAGDKLELGLPGWNDLAALAGLAETPSTGSSDTEVHLIDVGQGDAILLRQGGAFGLIDAGTPDAAEKLVGYLKSVGVKKLDFVLMTHAHADHIGGMPAVLEAFPVDRFILPDFSVSEVPTTRIFERTLTALKAQTGCKAETATVGTEIPLGEGSLRIVGAGVKSDGQNNSSVCTLFTAPGIRYLNTGDAEKKAELALVDSGVSLSADLFKAGHHGSTTSNTEELLRAASPRFVAISCGADNDYGHPHEEVVQRLAALGAEVVRTDEAGSIVYAVEESGITVRTER